MKLNFYATANFAVPASETVTYAEIAEEPHLDADPHRKIRTVMG